MAALGGPPAATVGRWYGCIGPSGWKVVPMRMILPVAALPLALSLGFLAPAWLARGASSGDSAATGAAAAPSRIAVETFAAAVRAASPCVVTIVWSKPAPESLDEEEGGKGVHGVGSGVIVRRDGHIL